MGIIKKWISNKKGFTLLIAVIFMAVVLSIGLALGSLGYKQEVLASSALESQVAFYAADAGLECALRADEQDNAPDGGTGGDFAYRLYAEPTASGGYGSANFSVQCGPSSFTVTNQCYNGNTLNSSGVACTTGQWVTSWQIRLAYSSPTNPVSSQAKECAIVQIYKPSGSGTTYLFSQGYDVNCSQVGVAGVRFASRGLSASYQN